MTVYFHNYESYWYLLFNDIFLQYVNLVQLGLIDLVLTLNLINKCERSVYNIIH